MGVDKPTTLEIPLISPGEEGELEMGDVDYETSDSDFAEGHDIDDALEVAGSGPFQLNLSFCVCLVWAFNAALTMVTPFFVAGMRKEMELSAYEEGVTSASILFGFIVGNVAWGYLSDKWGRRVCIYYSVLGSGLSNCLGAMAPSWQLVALMRVATGCFIPGSMIASNSLISESVPRQTRGSWLAFLLCGSPASAERVIGADGGPSPEHQHHHRHRRHMSNKPVVTKTTRGSKPQTIAFGL